MKTWSKWIYRKHISTCPLMALDAPSKWWLGGEKLSPCSGSPHRRLVFLGRTQTLNEHKKTPKTGAGDLPVGKDRDPLHCPIFGLDMRGASQPRHLRHLSRSNFHDRSVTGQLSQAFEADLGRSVIRLQRIYNFWLFHAIILSILDV